MMIDSSLHHTTKTLTIHILPAREYPAMLICSIRLLDSPITSVDCMNAHPGKQKGRQEYAPPRHSYRLHGRTKTL